MRKTPILLLLIVGALGLCAQEDLSSKEGRLALWKDMLPGFRKPMDTSVLPEKIFGTKPIEVITKSTGEPDSGLKDIVAKISTLTVTGLVWSPNPAERRVLMGDIVMRQGQTIPTYVLDDGGSYTLESISKDHLHFKAQQGDGTNPVAFDVPFGLKDEMKNESTFSKGKNAKK